MTKIFGNFNFLAYLIYVKIDYKVYNISYLYIIN